MRYEEGSAEVRLRQHMGLVSGKVKCGRAEVQVGMGREERGEKQDCEGEQMHVLTWITDCLGEGELMYISEWEKGEFGEEQVCLGEGEVTDGVIRGFEVTMGGRPWGSR